MKTRSLIIAATLGFTSLAAVPAFAQSASARDREIWRLTDALDQSTGLPKSAPAIRSSSAPVTQNDRFVARLTDSRDMSTGLPMGAPTIGPMGMVGGNARDRAIERLTSSRDMSSGLPHQY